MTGSPSCQPCSEKPQKRHDYLYWELPRYEPKTGTYYDEAPLQAMRRGDWKAVRSKSGGPLELYNLANDPGESQDRALARPDLVAEF